MCFLKGCADCLFVALFSGRIDLRISLITTLFSTAYARGFARVEFENCPTRLHYRDIKYLMC